MNPQDPKAPDGNSSEEDSHFRQVAQTWSMATRKLGELHTLHFKCQPKQCAPKTLSGCYYNTPSQSILHNHEAYSGSWTPDSWVGLSEQDGKSGGSPQSSKLPRPGCP